MKLASKNDHSKKNDRILNGMLFLGSKLKTTKNEYQNISNTFTIFWNTHLMQQKSQSSYR
jgi:hypothetical protein